MDPSLEAVIVENRGFFTRAQALDCGWVDRDLAAAVRRGVIFRLRQGAYCPADIYDAADEVARHVIVARAALQQQRGRVALTGVSAAALRGYTLYGQDLSVVHLVRLDRGSARQEIGTKHHIVTDGLESQIDVVDGCPVVSAARTVWEVATMSSVESGVCTADSALRAAPMLLGQLRDLAGQFEHRPGSRRARVALHLADGRAESPGESLSRVLFYRRGIPMPELQHDVFDDRGRLVGTADFYWPESRHLGEFDGKIKYGRLVKPGEAPGDAVFREKRREDAMRACQYGMTRWTWVDLMPGGCGTLVRGLNDDLGRSRSLFRRAA